MRGGRRVENHPIHKISMPELDLILASVQPLLRGTSQEPFQVPVIFAKFSLKRLTCKPAACLAKATMENITTRTCPVGEATEGKEG